MAKVWEGIRKFLDVPKESTGSFFRHMRVPGVALGKFLREKATLIKSEILK